MSNTLIRVFVTYKDGTQKKEMMYTQDILRLQKDTPIAMIEIEGDDIIPIESSMPRLSVGNLTSIIPDNPNEDDWYSFFETCMKGYCYRFHWQADCMKWKLINKQELTDD